jgi:uncharacterized coiled-coil protein SlyX
LEEAENTAENLSATLAELSVEAGKITERVSILAGQLKKVSLSLILSKKEEVTGILDNEYIICRLIAFRIKDYAS